MDYNHSSDLYPEPQTLPEAQVVPILYTLLIRLQDKLFFYGRHHDVLVEYLKITKTL